MLRLVVFTLVVFTSWTGAVSAVEFSQSSDGNIRDGYAYVLSYDCRRPPSASNFGETLQRLGQQLTNQRATYIAFTLHDRQRLADVANMQSDEGSVFSEVVLLRTREANGTLRTHYNSCQGYFFIPANVKLFLSATESRARLNEEQVENLLEQTADFVNPLFFFIKGDLIGAASQVYIDQAKKLAQGAFEIVKTLTPNATNTRTFPLEEGRYTLVSDAVVVDFEVRRLQSGFLGDTKTSFSSYYKNLIDRGNSDVLISLDDDVVQQCRERRQDLADSGFISMHDRVYALYTLLEASGATTRQIYDCLVDNRSVLDSYLTFRSNPYSIRFIPENILSDEDIDRFSKQEASRWPDDQARRVAVQFHRQFVRSGQGDLRRAVRFGDPGAPERLEPHVDALASFVRDPVQIEDNTFDFLIMGDSTQDAIGLAELIARLQESGLRHTRCFRVSLDVATLEPELDKSSYMFILTDERGPEASVEIVVRVGLSNDGSVEALHFTESWLPQLYDACA